MGLGTRLRSLCQCSAGLCHCLRCLVPRGLGPWCPCSSQHTGTWQLCRVWGTPHRAQLWVLTLPRLRAEGPCGTWHSLTAAQGCGMSHLVAMAPAFLGLGTALNLLSGVPWSWPASFGRIGVHCPEKG